VGYAGFAPKREQWGLAFEGKPLSFSDNNVLIASFITREAVTTLGRRDQLGDSLPLKLHGIFLDATTEKVRATREWSTTRPRGGIVATGDGRFVVLTPALMALYSPTLEALKEFSLSLDEQAHLWNFYPSPTGKSILVEYHNCAPNCESNPPAAEPAPPLRSPETSFGWIDTASLQAHSYWEGAGTLGFVSISDGEVAFSRTTFLPSKRLNVHEVLIRERDGPWRTFCRARLGYDVDTGCDYPEFVSNDVLALYEPHALNLTPAKGGAALLRAKFPEDEWVGRPLHPSAGGNRLAVSIWAHKGGSSLLDIDYHAVLKRITVFDIPSRQWVYTLDAKREKIRSISGLALSPDGTRMAILADGVVGVYQLPDAEAHVASGGSF
jgi:hypothetical protein